jgi:2-polyprenyl-3-methyl-5-hydroxy-6-metoxy-1,4-benzoquinol methylase
MLKRFSKNIKKFLNFSLNISYIKYEIEVEKLGDSAAVVLDLGCGGGELLYSLKAKFPQHEYIGVDRIIKENSSKDGVKLIPGNLFDFINTEKFIEAKIIFLNDVIEHLSQEEIVKLFSIFNNLKPETVIYCQFPNCASPFGLRNQTGDPTHVTMLSAHKIEKLIAESKLNCQLNIYGVEEIARCGHIVIGFFTGILYYKILCKILNCIFVHSIGWNKYFWEPNLLIKIRKK